MALNIVSAILFSPRGGSAHVARALTRELLARGCPLTLVSGSRGPADPEGDARVFYDDVQVVDFGPALASDAPLRYEGPAGTAPVHPSFEDRPGAPDRAFAELDDLDYERQVRAWCRALERAGARDADVLYLHHLTPMNEAAERVAPDVPVVSHLHGTELLMLEQIAEGPPGAWRYADRWEARLRRWAGRCARLLAVPAGVERARSMLRVPDGRLVALPGGVDTRQFAPRTVERADFWPRVLADHPRGWLPDERPGSARYGREEAAGLARRVVLLYVGRFTAVKRLDLLLAAFAAAQDRARTPTALVLVGGHPGEWQGEHPAEIAARLGVPNVFLAGWYAHDELADFFAAADAVVLASDREQFGQVLLEAMACGLPAITTRSLGPASIIEDGRTGWLASPGDAAALAQAIAQAVDDAAERSLRGRVARHVVCERFAWSTVTDKLLAVMTEVAEARGPGEERRGREDLRGGRRLSR